MRVIRPFVYVREKDLRQFAESNKLPVIAENCPACFEAPKVSFSIEEQIETFSFVKIGFCPRTSQFLWSCISQIHLSIKVTTKHRKCNLGGVRKTFFGSFPAINRIIIRFGAVMTPKNFGYRKMIFSFTESRLKMTRNYRKSAKILCG